MRQRLWIFALALTMALSAGAQAATHVVKVRNFEFSPANLTIETGDIVRWEWESGSHTTTNGLGSSAPDAGTLWDEVMTSGNSVFQRTFNDVGTFPFFCRPHEFSGMKGTIVVQLTTGVFEDESGVPDRFSLAQNYPNPFNSSTVIKFGLETGSHTTLTIYNLLGQHVAVALDEFKPAGNHLAFWDGFDSLGHTVPSGIYFYRLTSGSLAQTRKMVLMK